jgi:ribosomal protein L16 Arg81 hydroxylase
MVNSLSILYHKMVFTNAFLKTYLKKQPVVIKSKKIIDIGAERRYDNAMNITNGNIKNKVEIWR